ncbi:hypothetical protein [Streptomyces sp. ID38640]|uniref:hypothetical protein n=1 Tax=Streptomyces sp. ID38640 TaxID=1265399 RepID=UPI0037DA2F01
MESGSRRDPDLLRSNLAHWMQQVGIHYRWERDLGGFRKPPVPSRRGARRAASGRGRAIMRPAVRRVAARSGFLTAGGEVPGPVHQFVDDVAAVRHVRLDRWFGSPRSGAAGVHRSSRAQRSVTGKGDPCPGWCRTLFRAAACRGAPRDGRRAWSGGEGMGRTGISRHSA